MGFDFKRNKEQPTFGRTIGLIKNLLGEMDEKAKLMRKKKVTAAS